MITKLIVQWSGEAVSDCFKAKVTTSGCNLGELEHDGSIEQYCRAYQNALENISIGVCEQCTSNNPGFKFSANNHRIKWMQIVDRQDISDSFIER